MDLKDLVIASNKFLVDETRMYSPDIEILYDIAMTKGIELAEKLNANMDIVKIGIALMDCKLPLAQKNGTPEKHVEMSINATKELLKDYNLTDEVKEIIINCVAAHHGKVPYLSIEAEICANADCYKFIYPKGVFAYASILGRRFHNLNKELEALEFKIDEKYNILSLSVAKEELEEYYQYFKKMFEMAKENK